MIELVVCLRDAQGGERLLRDWLSDSDRRAAKLRSCCVAVDALEFYELGEIGQDDFPGHDVQVKISVQNRRGFPHTNQLDEYRSAPADSSVVSLRTA